jgi:hypothetical protein
MLHIKTLLLTIALLVTGSAWADWVQVAGNDSASTYIDPATIRRDGNFRKVWQLQDLKQQYKDGTLSRRVRTEYDCMEERVRILFLSTHSSAMAGGDTLFSHDTADTWTNVPPNTPSEIVLKIVCAK